MEIEILKSAEEARRLSPVVSRRVTARELTGFGGTTLDVGAGATAVQTDSRGASRVLASGRHKVRGLLARRVPAIQLVSPEALTLSAHVANVMAGGASGELLDGDLRYGVSVADPARFSREVGRDHAELRGADLARLLEMRVQSVIAPLLKHYAVADLIGGGPAAEKLLGAFRESLAAALSELGLSLKWVHTPVLYRAEDAVAQTRRAMELRQQLRQIELDDKMDELQKQAELEDFRRQLSTDAALGAVGAGGADVGAALDERVRALANHVVGRIEQRAKGPGYFSQLVAGGAPPAPKLSPAQLSRADSLLREQVSGELTRVYTAAREARSRAHADGNIDLALRLKELERQIDSARDELPRATPAYLGGANVSLIDLERALANDDALLARAQALADAAQEALSAAIAKQETGAAWSTVESALAAFRHQFAARSRL